MSLDDEAVAAIVVALAATGEEVKATTGQARAAGAAGSGQSGGGCGGLGGSDWSGGYSSGGLEDEDVPERASFTRQSSEVDSVTLAVEGEGCCHAVKMYMKDPTLSNTAMCVQGVIVTLILVSTVSVCLETIPELHKEYMCAFAVAECVFTVIFSIEIVLRLILTEPDGRTCGRMRNFFANKYNTVDVLSTVPGFATPALWLAGVRNSREDREVEELEGAFREMRMVRMVQMMRLLRVLRIAKFARHSEGISTVLTSLTHAVEGLGVLITLTAAATTISATGLYYLEGELEGTSFASIPAAMWWSSTTLSTVGYGDVVPITVLGKVWAAVWMVAGVILISACVGMVQQPFIESYHANLTMNLAAADLKKAEVQVRVAQRNSGYERSHSRDLTRRSILHNQMDQGLQGLGGKMRRWVDSAEAAVARIGDDPSCKERRYAKLALGHLRAGGEQFLSEAEAFVQELNLAGLVVPSGRRCSDPAVPCGESTGSPMHTRASMA